MEINELNTEVSRLGECRIPSPMSRVQVVSDDEHLLYHSNLKDIEAYQGAGERPPYFEMAGPRERIYFDPSKLKCGIVTCGGICPGLNDVVRAIVMGLHYHYGVRTVFGFGYGYEGLSSKYGHVPMELTPDMVEDAHEKGGTILGSSRGAQDISEMVGTLERMNAGILFTVEGDGTLRGAQAIAEEVARWNLKVGVVGIPKTIDNKYIDPSYTIRSMPAIPHDSGFCLLLGHNAVHAGMAGRTNMVVGFWKNEFTHVPIPMAVSRRKKIDPKGRLWSNVLACRGQPGEMR
ncbi:MAG: hypothetical protein GTO14_04615 [Anaerolineales bacterium]|nr:hypothetical protein [Anaerolineales bacterium]